MDDLIQALQILAKYDKPQFPTHCEHDTLYVLIDPAEVSKEDKKTLKKLGFVAGDVDGTKCFYSFKFGSA